VTSLHSLRSVLLVLSLGCAVALSTGASASADGPDLSTGCATLHQFDGSDGVLGSSGTVRIGPVTLDAGEQVRFLGTADGDVRLQLDVTGPDATHALLGGASGEMLRYQVQTGGTYTLELTSAPATAVQWRPGCGVPPLASVASLSATTFEIGDQPRINFGCAGQTNQLASCAFNGRNFGLCSQVLGCTTYLDTSTAGEHAVTITATDVRGLETTTAVSYIVVRKHQTVLIASSPPASASYHGRPYAVSTQASSGLPVAVSVDPAAKDVCAVSGTTVSLVGVGTCVIHADQFGDDEWAPAPQATQSFFVDKSTAVLVPKPADKGVLGLTASTFSASVSRTFDVMSGPVDPIAGEKITFAVGGEVLCTATTGGDGVGTCSATIGLVNALTQSTYTATYAGDAHYKGATATGKLG
jgi:hypothetical protein